MWLFSCFSTCCWTDHLCAISLHLLLYQRPFDYIYGNLLLGSLFCSVTLFLYPFLSPTPCSLTLKLGSVSPLNLSCRHDSHYTKAQGRWPTNFVFLQYRVGYSVSEILLKEYYGHEQNKSVNVEDKSKEIQIFSLLLYV